MDVEPPAAELHDQEEQTSFEKRTIQDLGSQFPLWRQQLEDGFSLLFYGLGSKHALVTAFASESLADKTVVTINGADANTTPARMAAAIASSCQPDPSTKGRKGPAMSSASAAELARWILDLATEQQQKQQQQRQRKQRQVSKQRQQGKKQQGQTLGRDDSGSRESASPWLCIAVHNLDAAPIRASPACISLLALLAACPAIAVIASVDHVLSSALFDRQTLSLFNFATHHVVTRGAYTKEASAFSPATLSHTPSASAAAQAALLVLRSLPPNACQIFTLIAQPFLSSAGGGKGRGSGGGSGGDGRDGDGEEEGGGSGQKNQPQALPFAQLYSLCRARFLVTSEVTLRAHLREFEDHALVRTFRQADGTESVGLLLTVPALAQVMEQLGGK